MSLYIDGESFAGAGGLNKLNQKTVFVGPSAPTTTFTGQVWIDTANNIAKFRNPADSAFIDLVDLLSAQTISGAKTITGLTTFDRDPNPPFAVTSGSDEVLNLIADIIRGFPFGDGQDGDVTISTTVNLGKSMQYNNLTIASGGILTTLGGFDNPIMIQVKGTLIIQSGGDIEVNGTDGVNGINGSNVKGGNGGNGGNGFTSSGGAGGTVGTSNGPGGAGNNGNRGAGGGGGAGATRVTGAGSNVGGAGGNGGNGQHENNLSAPGGGAGGNADSGGASGGAAGSGGTVTQLAPREEMIEVLLANSRSELQEGVGAGGGGGGAAENSNGDNDGGGGGGGGGGAAGMIIIMAKTIDLQSGGDILAQGADGGDGGDGGGNAGDANHNAGGGGGGGGGAGGMIILIYDSLTETGTISVTGGALGTGGTAFGGAQASAGANGSAGGAGVIRRLSRV